MEHINQKLYEVGKSQRIMGLHATMIVSLGQEVGAIFGIDQQDALDGADGVIRMLNDYDALVDASEEVLANWEKGDLAAAVRGLAKALGKEEENRNV